MSPYEIAALILAGAAAVVALSWLVFRYRYRRLEVTTVTTTITYQTPEMLGDVDGRKDIPNNLTCVPFPTPAMEGLYEEGEQKRAELESSHAERLRNLEIRQQVLAKRADDLQRQITSGNGTSGASNPVRQAALVAESRAARHAAIETEKKNHEAQLAALDACTQMQVNQYWAANLRARNRSTPDQTDLDTLIVPEPTQWRALRRDEEPGAAANGQTDMQSSEVQNDALRSRGA